MKDKEIRFLDLSIDDIKIKSDKTKLLQVFGILVQTAHRFYWCFWKN